MSKKVKALFISTILILILFVTPTYADNTKEIFGIDTQTSEIEIDEGEQIFLQQLQALSSSEKGLSWLNKAKFKKNIILCSSTENTYSLVKLYSEDEEYLGYCIWNDSAMCVVELSEGICPFEAFFEGDIPQRANLKYCEAYYLIEYLGMEYYLDEFGYVIFSSRLDATSCNPQISPTGILPGVKHNLQGNSNCIANSLSNILYYWMQHGYQNLGMNMSYTQMRERVALLFNGKYENSKVPYVLQEYVAWTTHSEYSVKSEVKQYPSINLLISEIDNKRPCMLGFARGTGSYSEKVGHMTMCYGYVYPGDGSYLVVLADGHSNQAVYKKWNSKINDYIITIEFSK